LIGEVLSLGGEKESGVLSFLTGDREGGGKEKIAGDAGPSFHSQGGGRGRSSFLVRGEGEERVAFHADLSLFERAFLRFFVVIGRRRVKVPKAPTTGQRGKDVWVIVASTGRSEVFRGLRPSSAGGEGPTLGAGKGGRFLHVFALPAKEKKTVFEHLRKAKKGKRGGDLSTCVVMNCRRPDASAWGGKNFVEKRVRL